jgi:hypothetical protein
MFVHRTLLTIVNEMDDADNGKDRRTTCEDIDIAQLNQEISGLKRILVRLRKDRLMMMRRKALPHLKESLRLKLDLRLQYDSWRSRKDDGEAELLRPRERLDRVYDWP